ncbi:glycosyltransferase family 4 protein [Arthrobacter sp. SAFR-044]|uniref:glycosyltransferase family 4 protein n=1 Tax=Arthrobacter sp. SAFR-044 TaxID=3387278 RepID=UPI003F7BE8F1
MALHKRKILLGVTVDISLGLMDGFPQYLSSRGWDVHVVSSPGPLLDELDDKPGITTHRIVMARRPAPIADLVALGRWVLLLQRIRPDITSVGTPKAGLLGGIAAWLTRVPTRIYLLRGLRLETAEGIKFKMLMFPEKLAFATAHKALAVSQSLRARAVGLGLVPSEKVIVLGAGSSNGVDLLHFKSIEPKTQRGCGANRDSLAMTLGLDFNVPVIGFVGRLTVDKGLAQLAKARDILHSRGVDHQLLIVGGVDDSEAPAALQALERSGRYPSLTGYVRDTAPYYRLMDLLCLPTRREGFPNVVLEASATGVPTVTTDATGAVDSVIDGETGIITQMDSALELADALAMLIEDPSLRKRMGEAARQRAHDYFRQPLVWGLLEEFYARSLLLEPADDVETTLRSAEY